jgi:uncharacterized integral membrane protein
VEKTREWLAQHPAAVGLAFAFLVGASTYNAFCGGIRVAELRATLSDHARAASEALGG